MVKIEYFSMFSGIGGFELGIQKATKGEWRCVGFSEIDKYAVKTYLKHFPDHKNYGDATKINPRELPEFDLLCGGFPCQAFSLTGKRMGFKDTRGTLFFEIARVVKERRPQFLLLENVKGLLSHDNGRTFATILTSLDELGYNAEWQVINGKYSGVCQDRQRLFIIGYNREARGCWEQVFPIRQNGKADFVLQTLTARYFASNSNGNFICYPKERGEDMRRLTILECERLMGFPDNWTEGQSNSQRYKQVGNAVIPNVIEIIIKKLSEVKSTIPPKDKSLGILVPFL